MKYIPTIGLEVHVQLKTQSKMFCACATSYGEEPNSRTCPVCLGMPGAMPVLNEEAIRKTILTGLMLGCKNPEVSKWDRKNYFYPDMPKNYQISQYDQPLCQGGGVPLHDMAYPRDARESIVTPDKVIHLERIHLEEDVAKSTHFSNNTGIDFNRAGTPLMEIVSEAEIASPEEAFAFITSLRQILIYGGVSAADMEKGQLRCDCNISVRPETREEWGTKVEIKNMNSISAIRRAIAYEIDRQIECCETGEPIVQSTRRWDEASGQTYLMRIKEMAHDYRYFPEPDLLPLKTGRFVEEMQGLVPELPAEKRARFENELGVSAYDAGVFAADLPLAAYFEEAAKGARKPKNVANWILNDLQSALSSAEVSLSDCPVKPAALDELVNLLDDGKINNKQAKEVFAEMFASGGSAAAIVKERGLEQVSDSGAIEALAAQVIAANPDPVADYKSGNEKAINFLKGQVMKLSKGKANPKLAGEVLAAKLS